MDSNFKSVANQKASDVHELVKLLNDHLKQPPLGTVYVRGEIAEARQYPNAIYFKLKDTSGFNEAVIDCILWTNRLKFIDTTPQDGQEYIIRGKFSVYEKSGKLSLNAEAFYIQGQGLNKAKLEQLFKKLEQEGLFAESHKRSLPKYPRLIGVVTSKAGAVIHDISQTLSERNDSVALLLSPCAVQGPGADLEIIAALNKLASRDDVDMIIIARGGGSEEDLMCFNSEALARAIYACPKPVLASIGHAINTTIAELVADENAQTPTRAAEKAAIPKNKLLEELEDIQQGLCRDLLERINYSGSDLDHLSLRLARSFANLFNQRYQQLENLASRQCFKGYVNIAASQRQALQEKSHRLHLAMARICQQRQKDLVALTKRRPLAEPLSIIRQKSLELQNIAEKLASLSPLRVLERGYAVVSGPRGVVTKAEQLKAQEQITIRLQDGSLQAVVTDSTISTNNRREE